MIDSPLGSLTGCFEMDADLRRIHCCGLYFPDHKPAPKWSSDGQSSMMNADEAFVIDTRHRLQNQLAEYFRGIRTSFDIAIRLSGTPFQRDVWSALSEIPYGEIRRYGQVAQAIGKPTAIRAVGSAIARNPLSILIPCHRVVARDGKLAGFAGGLARKQALLNLERSQLELRLSDSTDSCVAKRLDFRLWDAPEIPLDRQQ